MRCRPSVLPAVVAVLLCGGWVCQSNADNRCPGALTCDFDVPNVCCPFGSAVWCGSCAPNADVCSGEVRACTDLARVLECSFSAKITTARCIGRATGADGVELWSIEASGQLTGCGEEVAFIAVDGERDDHSCGSWSRGVFGGCVPPDDDISTTHWSLARTFERRALDTEPLVIEVLRGHGAKPVLARAEITCVP